MKEKIEKFLDYTYNNRIIHILIIIIVTIAMSLHMKDFQIYDTHDGPFHLLRILDTNKQLKNGIFPALISPYSWNGLGVGMNIFYPPISTYVPILIMNIFNSPAWLAVKVLCIISIFLSGIFMYCSMNEFTENRKIAIISAIIYMIIPYKLNNIYVRAAIGEVCANIFIPLVFMGLHSLIEKDGKKHYLIAIGAIGIILSHTISTMYVAIFSAFYVLLHIKKIINWVVIRRLLINCLFIVLIGGIFIFPYLETSNSSKYRINTDEVMGTYNEYLKDNTVKLDSILKNEEIENHVILYLGLPAIIGIALTIINLPLLIKEKKLDRNYLLFLGCLLLCIWMSTKAFPWLKVPKIFAKLQFPWRMLGFGSFFISFIAGINYFNILEKMPNLYFVKTILIITLISVAVINSMKISKKLKTWGVFKDTEIEKSWEDGNWVLFTNYDFAPIKVEYENILENKIPITLYSNNNNVKVTNENITDKLVYKATVENLQKNDIIWIPYLYYPYYELKITDNGKEIIKQRPAESNDGLIQFKINNSISQKVELEIYYKPTVVVLLSYFGAILSTIALIIYIIFFRLKMKK